MNKTLIACAIAAGFSVAAAGAQAAGHGGNGSGGHGGGNWSGGHGGGNWSGGHGGGNWSGHGNWSGGHGNWNGGRGWHGTNWHGHGSRVFGSVFLGWPWYTWGPSYYYDYPAYSYAYYGAPAYYDSTQIYVEPPGGSEVAPPARPQAQYYCPDSGYYPAVQACPRGWLRVVPDGAPPR